MSVLVARFFRVAVNYFDFYSSAEEEAYNMSV
jgi:hypothetical protein